MTPVSANVLSAPRTDGVNVSYTMIGVAHGSERHYAAPMPSPTPIAGGFFLILPILVGFVWGLTNGRAMEGAIIGLGVGLLLASAVWLVTRFGQRR